MQTTNEQLTDFHEISYERIVLKTIRTFQILLKSDKNNGHFTWKPTGVSAHISKLTEYNFIGIENVSNKSVEEN
jgi:hypothetical protein